MLQFHSNLLKSQARTARGLSRRTRLRRLLGTAFLLAILGLMIWSIAARALSPDGPGRLLYGLHDYVYLPLRGWLFTRWYPYSIIGFSLLALVAANQLYSYLTGLPIVRSRHAQWSRWAILRPSLHPLLLGSTRLLRRLRIEPVFLRRSVQAEIDNRLESPWPKPAAQARRLHRLLLLGHQLDQDTGAQAQAAWETLIQWQSLLNHQDLPGESRPALLALASELLLPKLAAGPVRPQWSASSLLEDAARLHLLHGTLAADDLPGLPHPDSPGELRYRLRCRLDQLLGWHESLQRGTPIRQHPRASKGPGLDQLARFATELVLHEAITRRDPDFAQAWIESFERLRCTRHVSRTPPATRQDATLQSLLHRVPSALDHARLARLRQDHLDRARKAAHDSHLLLTRLLHDHDWTPEEWAADAARLAAGPAHATQGAHPA